MKITICTKDSLKGMIIDFSKIHLVIQVSSSEPYLI